MTLLIIDVGSSSLRAMLFDEDAVPIPGALIKRAHQFNTAPPGASTADAAQLRQLCEACIDDLLTHPQARHIRAVGIATFAGNLLGVDADYQPITPIYTYADTRSAATVALLKQTLSPSEIHQRTGCLLHTAYAPALLHHLKQHEATRFETVSHWLDFATYLYRAWFGREVPCSYSIASWSGLLNRLTLTWDEALLKFLNLPTHKLPILADVSAWQQGLGPAYARRWPALCDVPFCLAVGDGAAANIGSGAAAPPFLALTIGTTAAIRKADPLLPDKVPDGLWHYRIRADLHLTGGATSEGGNIYQWAKNTLRLPDAQYLEAALLENAPISHRLAFLPLLAGERAPGWRPDATGIISGLRLSTTPLELLQAALEGVALRLAVIMQRLKADSPFEVVASGGALVQSPAWAQIIANALNAPLHLIDVEETTARGTAILVLNAVTKAQVTSFPPGIRHTIQPNPEHAALMQTALAQQQHIYDQWR